MIRTLLLDDEPLILRTMQAAIERCNPGYRIVGTAADGRTGLELVERLHPDVVFTDIRMPVMDGLGFVEAMRQRGIHTLVVIVSGYSDFEYAQKAIALGVTDYLVKPWKADQMARVLARMETEISRRRHSAMQILMQRAMIAAPGEKERASWAALAEGERFALMHLCFGTVVSSRLSGGIKEQMTAWENRMPLPEMAQEHWAYPGRFPNETRIIVQLDGEEGWETTVCMAYESLCDLTDGFTHVTMAVLEPFSALSELFERSAQTESALLKGARYGRSSLIESESAIPDDHPDPNELAGMMVTLKDAMQKPRQGEIRRIAEEIFALCRDREYTQLQLEAVVRRMLRRVPAMQDQDIADVASTLVISCDSCDELPEAFVSWLDQKAALFTVSEGGRSVEEIAEEIRKYIHEHIQEKLVIQELAAQFGINYSYLSVVFRKRYGISLNEYINSERIRRAAELMRSQQEWKFKDIAEMVGFPDPYYFSRVFKAVLGVSPTQYRKSLEE